MRRVVFVSILFIGISLLFQFRGAHAVSTQVDAGKDEGSFETQAKVSSGGASETLKKILEKLPLELRGFFEARGGIRTQNDPNESKTATLGETRLQLQLLRSFDWTKFKIKGDLIYDGVAERGEADYREVNAIFTPLEFMELKVGRQILTWGTGDNIFINDLFPKDFTSFFIGREDEYMKAPSDALKTSFFTNVINIDFVYTPQFDPDRLINGERLSYYNSFMGRLAGEDAVIHPQKRDEWFEDDETAWRLYRDIEGYGLALYGYHGFWKNPVGFDPQVGKATFPRLSVYGLSLRGTVWKGIGNFEMGHYDSADDRDGTNQFVPNSQLRFLAGYEQECAKDFTVGVQYYLEQMLDYGGYKRNLSSGGHAADEYRHGITIRLTELLMYQNLRLSIFTFYSPSDQDAYVTPTIHYNITDQWSAEAGANIFWDEKDYTFFGQFKDNTNIYSGLRWSF